MIRPLNILGADGRPLNTLRLSVGSRLGKEFAPVDFEDVPEWLLGVVDVFQDASDVASSVLLPVPLDRGILAEKNVINVEALEGVFFELGV